MFNIPGTEEICNIYQNTTEKHGKDADTYADILDQSFLEEKNELQQKVWVPAELSIIALQRGWKEQERKLFRLDIKLSSFFWHFKLHQKTFDRKWRPKHVTFEALSSEHIRDS